MSTLTRSPPCAHDRTTAPPRKGVSQPIFAEDSRDEDIVLGCRVLADAAASILAAGNARR